MEYIAQIKEYTGIDEKNILLKLRNILVSMNGIYYSNEGI
jgi:hypothetical protein